MSMKSENSPTISESGFGNPNVIYVPCGYEDVYKSAPGWSTYANYIQEDCSA